MNSTWEERHIAAIDEVQAHISGFTPDNAKKRMESAFVLAMRSLRLFAEGHAALYGSPIGADGVLGEAWLDMWRGVRAMLNGELGRLDGGSLDRALLNMAKEFGFDDKDIGY